MEMETEKDARYYQVLIAQNLQHANEASADFSCGGEATEIPANPGLTITNHGIVQLPVDKLVADSIIKVANQAPFGKGRDTVVDKNVRDSWEIDAKDFQLTNPKYNSGLKKLVERVGHSLGLPPNSIEAIPYKLLLYEEGGHFLPHKDTEKEKGMVATLIIQLPSVYKGGELVVRFGKGESKVEKSFDFGQSSEMAPFECHYAAHFADVEHEIKTVTSGYRLAITYSLCYHGTETISAAENFASTSKLAKAIAGWTSQCKSNHLALFLDHEYTDSGISYSGIKCLKGNDRKLVTALKSANHLLPPDQQLAFFIVHATQAVQYEGGGGGYYGSDWDEQDRTESIESWYTETGRAIEGGSQIDLDFKNSFLNVDDPTGIIEIDDIFEEANDVDEEVEEYTGNAGPSKSTTYHRYLIAMWPLHQSSQRLISTVGNKGCANIIAEALREHRTGKRSKEDVGKLIKVVLNAWRSSSYDNGGDHVMLKNLIDFGDVEVFCRFLKDKVLSVPDNNVPLLANAITQFGWNKMKEEIERIIKNLQQRNSFNTLVLLAETFHNVVNAQEDDGGLLLSCIKSITWSIPLDKLGQDQRYSFIQLLLNIQNDTKLEEICATVPKIYSTLPLLIRFTSMLLSKVKVKMILNSPLKSLLVDQFNTIEAIVKLGEPQFSWIMPLASFPHNLDVQNFFRSNSQTFVKSGFNRIDEARRFASQHSGVNTHHSANMEASGRSNQSTVRITKTKDLHQRSVNEFKEYQVHLEKLRAVLNGTTDATPQKRKASDDINRPFKKTAM